jgi:hypothetical protein
MHGLSQRALFKRDVPQPAAPSSIAAGFPRATTSLQQLTAAKLKFRTIYADPPWDYDNRASRDAARNRYGTMTLDEIRAEPVPSLTSSARGALSTNLASSG